MECVIKSREVDAFSWKHQESSVMTTSHFITLPFETKTENIILGFDMFHFEYPDKDHYVKDMGLNIRYNVLKERADTIIFHADMYMRDSSGHFMKYPKGDLKIRFNVLAYSHTTELPKDGVKIGAIDTFEIAYADGRDHHVSGYQVNSEKGTSYIYDNSGNNGKKTSTQKTIVIPHKDFEELKKQPVHFITGFNLAMESGDHHVRSTGFDAQNQENMFDLSDDSGQHASAMLSYLTYDI